jgi:D-amino-acid dehydrogenase
MLLVYKTEEGFRYGVEEAHVLAGAGVTSKTLDAHQVCALEPAVRPGMAGAVYFSMDAHLNPAEFVRGLARFVESKGVRIHANTAVTGIEKAGRRIETVKTTNGDFQPSEVVVAAGAWSPLLARSLKLNVPIQPAKGYSITVKRPAAYPVIPMLLGESRVAVTPMESPTGPILRFAGTLELAGMDLSINQRRVDAMRRAAGNYLVDMGELETIEVWRGLRPCTPDGLPIVGRPESCDNLTLAAGHAMIGISLGPITGKLVAQIVCGEKTDVDVKPLRVERF